MSVNQLERDGQMNLSKQQWIALGLLFLAVAGPETTVVVFGDKWADTGTIVQYLAFAGFLGSITIFTIPYSGVPAIRSTRCGWLS